MPGSFDTSRSFKRKEKKGITEYTEYKEEILEDYFLQSSVLSVVTRFYLLLFLAFFAALRLCVSKVLPARKTRRPGALPRPSIFYFLSSPYRRSSPPRPSRRDSPRPPERPESEDRDERELALLRLLRGAGSDDRLGADDEARRWGVERLLGAGALRPLERGAVEDDRLGVDERPE